MPEDELTNAEINGFLGKTVSLPGRLQVLEKVNPYEFRVQIDIMREGVNNNRWDYRNVETYWKTFLGKPILIAYVNGKIGDGHNMREVITPDGGTSAANAAAPVERAMRADTAKTQIFEMVVFFMFRFLPVIVFCYLLKSL